MLTIANWLSIGVVDYGAFLPQIDLHRLPYPLFERDCMENLLLCADCCVDYSESAVDWRRRMVVLLFLIVSAGVSYTREIVWENLLLCADGCVDDSQPALYCIAFSC